MLIISNVLEEAKHRGFIPAVKPLLDELMATGTYISDTLYRAFLRDIGEEELPPGGGEQR